MEKNYDNSYLEFLAKLLLPVKELSYTHIKDLSATPTIIDLGCGIGVDCRNIYDNITGNKTIIGIDNDPIAIDVAKANSNGQIRYLLAEANELPIPDNEADVVRCERIFQHLEFPEMVMKEIYRVLKPAGTAIILETDWTTISFGSSMIETERKLMDEKIYYDVRNGLASRTIGDHLTKAGFLINKIDIRATTVYRLEEAEYITGLQRNIRRLEAENQSLNDFVTMLKQHDDENRFSFTWNTLLYVAQKG